MNKISFQYTFFSHSCSSHQLTVRGANLTTFPTRCRAVASPPALSVCPYVCFAAVVVVCYLVDAAASPATRNTVNTTVSPYPPFSPCAHPYVSHLLFVVSASSIHRNRRHYYAHSPAAFFGTQHLLHSYLGQPSFIPILP